jgi:hypothetical protein
LDPFKAELSKQVVKGVPKVVKAKPEPTDFRSVLKPNVTPVVENPAEAAKKALKKINQQ